MVHIGPERIYRAGESLGVVGVAVMFVPSTLMYLVDCFGWRFTLGRHNTAVPFSRLFVIRTAGELVNATTPRNFSPDERSTTMTIRACKMIILFIAATAISGCLFWQGPLLSAPSSADDVAAHHNAAGIQAYKQKQWDRAREHFEGAVKIAPSLAEAHYNLGMVLYRQGKDAEAGPHFLKAAALAPENDVIQNAPPFTKVEAPSRPSEPSSISGGQGHSH